MKNLNYENLLYRRRRRMAGFIFLLALAIPLNAQDDFFDDENAVAESDGDAFEDDSFGDDDFESDSEPSLQFNGFASLGIRYWPHKNLQRVDTYPKFALDLKHTSSKTELEAMLRVDPNTIKDYPLDAISEFTLRAFLGDFVLSAGKMKLVWGKGDMLHVLDAFNANDFTDFTIPTYIDRRIAEPMIHFAYNAPIPLSLEIAWTPMMTPDRIALDGPWVPAQIEEMKEKIIGKGDNLIEEFKTTPLIEETELKKLLHDPIANEIQNITAGLAQKEITIEMKDIMSKLDKDALMNGVVFPIVTGTALKKLIENLKEQSITFSITELANMILPPKADGSDYTDDEIQTMLSGEPYLTNLTNYIAQEILKQEQKAKDEVALKLTDAIKKIENFDLSPFIKMGMNSFLPDMHNVKYGQCGIRLTGSVKSVDLGGQYYFGHYKTPSIDAEKLATASLLNGDLSSAIHYDPVHIFGFDLGAAVAMFNIKTEIAYYMTHDFKGTDPAVHNNSLQWVLGFDVNIPLNNLNLNIQNLGSWTLGFKKIKDNTTAGKTDMDWNSSEKSTNNKLILNISDNWLHGSLTDSVTLIWGIEHNDVVVMPAIKYKIKDELYVEGKGAYIYAKDKKSEFSNWKNNHFVQVSMEYKF